MSKVHSTILLELAALPQQYSKKSFESPASLESLGLECVRGYATLFTGLDFSTNSGSAVHIIGKNGVGKTSLLRILAGLSQPEHGVVLWNGLNCIDQHAQFQGMTAYLGHKIGLKESITVEENLEFLQKLELNPPILSVPACLEIFNMENYRGAPVFQLSAGQRQRVALCRILRSGAQLWLLDEPATALDDTGIEILQRSMSAHLEVGGMIVYTSHQPLVLESPGHSQLKLN